MPPKKRWRNPSPHSKGSVTELKASSGLDRQKLYAYALRLLTRRSLSSAELRKKLLDVSENEALASSTLEKLTSCGYLDDRKFVETFIRSRREGKHLGRARIEMELRQKGISPSLVEKVLEEVYPRSEVVSELGMALEKKLKALPLPIDAKKAARLYNYCLRKGFPSEVVYREIRQRLGEINQTDSYETDY
jgi:regulatory protein